MKIFRFLPELTFSYCSIYLRILSAHVEAAGRCTGITELAVIKTMVRYFRNKNIITFCVESSLCPVLVAKINLVQSRQCRDQSRMNWFATVQFDYRCAQS